MELPENKESKIEYLEIKRIDTKQSQNLQRLISGGSGLDSSINDRVPFGHTVTPHIFRMDSANPDGYNDIEKRSKKSESNIDFDAELLND